MMNVEPDDKDVNEALACVDTNIRNKSMVEKYRTPPNDICYKSLSQSVQKYKSIPEKENKIH